jgi:hypothetical protein
VPLTRRDAAAYAAAIRRLVAFVAGPAVVIASAAPVDAIQPVDPRVSFLLDPVAGAKGSSVNARGDCPSPGHGNITLRQPIRSDAIAMIAVGEFDTDSFGAFRTDFMVEAGHFTDPQPLRHSMCPNVPRGRDETVRTGTSALLSCVRVCTSPQRTTMVSATTVAAQAGDRRRGGRSDRSQNHPPIVSAAKPVST